METQTGTLYVVSTPIGNADDISLRAVKVLKLADVVVCEEGKVGARLLHQLLLAKTIEELNEHNEDEQTPKLLAMLREGKTLALVSDAGTPLLADPGLELVQQAVEHTIPVVAVPGASSIMTGIVTSGLPVHQFIFAGFLSRDSDERVAQLRDLANETRTVVLLETPYRLLPLLEAAAKVMPERRAFLGCNLTMPSETRHYGTVAELLEKFTAQRFKGEFVFVFAGRHGSQAVHSAAIEGGIADRPVRVKRSFGEDSRGRKEGGRAGSWQNRGGRSDGASGRGTRRPYKKEGDAAGADRAERREGGERKWNKEGSGERKWSKEGGGERKWNKEGGGERKWNKEGGGERKWNKEGSGERKWNKEGGEKKWSKEGRPARKEGDNKWGKSSSEGGRGAREGDGKKTFPRSTGGFGGKKSAPGRFTKRKKD